MVDHYIELFKRVEANCVAGHCRAADRDHRRRELRSAADARRARGAARVPAEVIDTSVGAPKKTGDHEFRRFGLPESSPDLQFRSVREFSRGLDFCGTLDQDDIGVLARAIEHEDISRQA